MSATWATSRAWCGRFWREKIEGDFDRRHVDGDGQATADSTASAGRQVSRFGGQAQAGQLFDRLAGRAVLAEADGVVGEHVERRCFISADMRTALRAYSMKIIGIVAP